MPSAIATASFKPETKRQAYELLRVQLENERTSFISHWRDLSDYLLPRRARFTAQDVNRGYSKNQKIIDSTGTLASRTLASGMMGGITSPARPWFRLTTPDKNQNESSKTKRWTDIVTQRISDVYLKSNLYNTLPLVYGSMGVFGTAAILVEEDFKQTIRTYPFPIGSYMIASDYRGITNVFFREFRMTVRNLILKFGRLKDNNGQPDWSIFSDSVKQYWDRSDYEVWIDVCHVIQPNENFDPNKMESKFKLFGSTYYEKGTGANGQQVVFTGDDKYDRYLSEKGYDYFPVLTPRWQKSAEDAYATSCPGMDALSDVKQLQLMQKRKAQAIEKMVNPAMTGPSALRSVRVSILPGDITYSDEREGQKGFRPSHEVTVRIAELVEDIRDIRMTVKRAFYEDLFLMLSQSDRREITAREVDERHEEKLLALGPVLEQLNQDLLDPLTDITFRIMAAQSDFEQGTGPIPTPPEELQGQELKVEYVSVMAQAQKLVGISSIERFSSFAVNFAGQTGDTRILKKINTDQMLDNYGDRLGIDSSMLRTDEEVAEIMAAEQKAQEQAQQMEMLKQATGAAKNLASADMSGDNALTQLVGSKAAPGAA